jgi:LPXTG-motif cell wall-anchored protein
VTWAGEGVSKDFTYSVSVRAGEKGQCVDYTNNAWIDELPAKKASAKVSVCAEADITVAKDATATYDTTYFWNITKDVDRFRAEVEPGGTGGFDYTVVAEPTTSRDSGWEMGGTITLTNPNAYKDVTVTLAAAYSGGGTCTPDSTTVVVPKASKTLVGYSCDFETQPDYGGTGTVTASWGGHQVQDTAKVPFKQDGQTDYKVDVYDDLTDPSASPKLLGQAVWDAAPENRTFRNHLDLAAAPGRCVDYTNTAWVDVTSNDISLIGTAVLPALDPFAQKTVTVREKAGITVAQTVTATYDTTYLWDISKVADRSYAEVGSGAKARFDYTVVAEPNGSTDSNLRMSGKITLTNPNTFEDVTVDLADEYTGGGVCTPESTTVLVPRAGTAEVGYSCSFPTKPALSGTNTVTATWDGRTETVTAQVDFEQVGRTDYEVEVYDDLTNPQGTPKLLGRAVWDAPEENRTFTNSLDLGAASGQCVDYTNTAWVKVAQTRNPSDGETVTVCEQGALSVVKDVKASYDRTYLWDIEKTVTPRTAEIPAGAQQDFRYQVTALPKGYRDSGWEMTGTITVSNPNEFEPVEATLEDVYDNDTADPSDDVACEVTYPAGLDHLVVPQATKSGDAVTPGKAYATYACDFTSAPAYSGDNHVTVHWGDGQTDSFTKEVVFDEDQSVDKTVTVYDDEVHLQTPVALGEATWAWDDQTDEPVPTAFPTYTLSEEGVAGQCTDYTNTAYVDLTQPGVANPKASATATLCVEAAPAVTKTVEASFDRSYHWLIDKSVDNRSVEVTDAGDATFGYTVKATPNGSTDSGYTMGGTITVTNPNTYTGGAITTTVTDVPSVGGGATCTVAGGDNVTLAPEESRTLSYTCSFTSEPSHEGTDTATATWTGPDTRPHTSSTEEQPVSFRLDRETDRTVTVTDSLTDPSVLGTATWNAQGDPTPFTYSLVHKGTENRCVDYTNTATIRETQQSDSETVTLCDQGALVVTKTAEASYDRAYGWAITKVAERTRVDTAAGETGTVSYTVGVTPQGFVDSGWEMTGSVSVSNPNDYKDVTVELSDVPDLGEGATCDFDETQDFQVSAGETRTFGYTCDFTGKPAYDGSDTVRVDWAGGHVEATSQAPFELDQATNETVTVTDDLLDPSELGQVTWDETGKTTEFTYALGFEGKAGQCETVTNTATIVETGQAASADVDVCGANVIAPVEEERQPPVKPRPPFSPLPPEHAIKPRPPVEILPETGAPGGMGIWSTLGGLMLATGVALLLRRRKAAS